MWGPSWGVDGQRILLRKYSVWLQIKLLIFWNKNFYMCDVYMWGGESEPMCLCMQVRVWIQVSSSITLIFEIGSLWSKSSLFCLGWMASGSQASACLCPGMPSAGLQYDCYLYSSGFSKRMGLVGWICILNGCLLTKRLWTQNCSVHEIGCLSCPNLVLESWAISRVLWDICTLCENGLLWLV